MKCPRFAGGESGSTGRQDGKELYLAFVIPGSDQTHVGHIGQLDLTAGQGRSNVASGDVPE